ncbi:MAG TPA: GTP-binding protein [Clostridium sp.]|nr:GTP-binding protein [Clostridium sp.]
MEKKINLYVLTGFLGSGKTTVLLRLLDVLKSNKVGVIQNEFGKLGIDGTILKRDNIEMVEINRGSIFCSCLKISFAQALAEMSKQDLEYVFVESSGLADPSNIEEILEGVKVLSPEATYDLKGVLCLIDGMNFREQLEDLETVNRQLKHCHMAIINKVDLIEEEELKNVIKEVRQVNQKCDIETCSFGEFSMDFLDKDLLVNKWAEGEESTNTVENKPKSLTMNFSSVVSKNKMEEFLNSIKKDSYRIKGFFNLNDGWQQIDVVGKNIDYKPCEPKEASQLVFISKIGPNIIKPIINNWNEIVGEKMELKN